jgi:O-antigen/teichoic acid export membrane protein
VTPPPDDSRHHFLRSAYSLVINTAATGALGVLFWIVAARVFPPETVGRDSALIVTMITISTICQVNLPNLFVRFLPEQGDPSRVILWGFVANSGLALVLGMGAMAIVPRVSDELTLLSFGSWVGWLWTASLALWGIFALQDAALTALRHAPWVAGKNAVFGVLKLLCLPLFLVLGAETGIFLAWVVPMILMLLPINALIFRRAVRAHVPAPDDGTRAPLGSPAVRRFLILDYGASTFIQGLYTVLPLLVLGILGSTANAYFWIPFSLITAVDMMSLSIATSMTVEGAFAKDRLAALARVAVRRFALIVAGAGAALALAAPLVLMPFGPEYVENGTAVLRVLSIGVVCHGVIELYIGLARVRRQGWALLAVAASRCALALTLCSVLGSRHGTIGIAWGWALMSLVMALAVLAPTMSILRGALDAAGAVPADPPPPRPWLRPWTAARPAQRLAAVTSALALVSLTGLAPAAVAAVLAVAFLVTAPGVVLVTLLARRGMVSDAEPGLTAAIGLATGVVAAQLMLWLHLWHGRVGFGLLAAVCLGLIVRAAAADDGPLLARPAAIARSLTRRAAGGSGGVPADAAKGRG